MIRAYICPVVGDGTKQTPYQNKGFSFGYQYGNFIPSKPDGTPKSPWTLTVFGSGDFTAIDADIECDDLFGGDLPASINSRDDFRAFIRTRNVNDVPLARRNAIIAVLDKYGVDHADFTGQTPLWRVFKRVISTLWGSTDLEIDDQFPVF